MKTSELIQQLVKIMAETGDSKVSIALSVSKNNVYEAVARSASLDENGNIEIYGEEE